MEYLKKNKFFKKFLLHQILLKIKKYSTNRNKRIKIID